LKSRFFWNNEAFFLTKKSRQLYFVLIASIMTLLVSSQALVQYKLNEIERDGQLINDAGRMRMLSQRLILQCLKEKEMDRAGSSIEQTSELFAEHIRALSTQIDKSFYSLNKQSFDSTQSIALEIVELTKIFQEEDAHLRAFSLEKLLKIGEDYLVAQNKLVSDIQVHYESKLSRISTLEIVLTMIALLIIIGEVIFIFLPLDKKYKNKVEALDCAIKAQNVTTKTISHDLRTPLGAISSAYSLLKGQIDYKDPGDEKLFEIIGEASNQSIATVSAILVEDESRSKATESVVTSLRAVIQAQLSLFRAKNPNCNRITFEKGNCSAKVNIDIHGMSRVFQNLIQNALNYSDGMIKIELVEDATSVTARIEDRGEGIDKRIRDWFNSESGVEEFSVNSEKGFGLGLKYVKSTVSENGGTIKITRPKSAQGTVFNIIIPRLV